VLSWFGDFFRALPDALRALYQFGDPDGAGQGWLGILVVLIWGVFLIGGPLAVAKFAYDRRREWLSATMGAIASVSILWWAFGVLPSAWIYYVDANQAILADAIIPTSFTVTVGGTFIPVATDLYNVIRDSVVIMWNGIALVATFWAALAFQKRYPRTLAPGEERRETSGGYR
jgi:hypothetical protein